MTVGRRSPLEQGSPLGGPGELFRVLPASGTPDTCRHLLNRSPHAAAHTRDISAPLSSETKEASAPASATYLSGHERLDFLHVEIGSEVPAAKN